MKTADFVELIEDAIKKKSWPLVKYAIEKLKESTYEDIFIDKTPAQSIKEPVFVTGMTIENPKEVELNTRPNLFSDDGFNPKVGNVSLPSYREQIQHFEPQPRDRQEYRKYKVRCGKCGQECEVEPYEAGYYKVKRGEESPYVCTNCRGH